MTTSDNSYMVFEGNNIIIINPAILIDGHQPIAPDVCKNLSDIIMEFAIQSYDIKFGEAEPAAVHNISYFLQHFEPYFNHITQQLKTGSLKYDSPFQLLESSDQLAAFHYRISNFLNISLAMCNSRRKPIASNQNAKRQCIRSD